MFIVIVQVHCSLRFESDHSVADEDVLGIMTNSQYWGCLHFHPAADLLFIKLFLWRVLSYILLKFDDPTCLSFHAIGNQVWTQLAEHVIVTRSGTCVRKRSRKDTNDYHGKRYVGTYSGKQVMLCTNSQYDMVSKTHVHVWARGVSAIGTPNSPRHFFGVSPRPISSRENSIFRIQTNDTHLTGI